MHGVHFFLSHADNLSLAALIALSCITCDSRIFQSDISECGSVCASMYFNIIFLFLLFMYAWSCRGSYPKAAHS